MRLFFYFIFCSILFIKMSFAQVSNKIVLRVGNEIVTNFDVKNKILGDLILSNNEINQDNIYKYKKVVLNFLVENKLKKIEVEKYNIKKNKINVNSYFNSMSLDALTLKQKYEQNGIDFNYLLDEIETEMRWKDLIFNLYSKKIEIDDNILDSEINKFVKNNSSSKEFQISKIEVPFTNSDDVEQKKNTIQKEILSDGFEKIAIRYGNLDAGKANLGWINADALSKEVNRILINMKIDEISPPIIKQNSIIFLKLNNVRRLNIDKADLVKIKNDLINQKKNEQFNLYSKSHLSKLRNSSFIEYK